MKKVLFNKAIERYRSSVSVLKKGYAQESYRIAQLSRSFLGNMFVHEITSVDIATYRDARLSTLNQKTKKLISPATVRLEMSLLSSFFDICRIEWGYCDKNPVSNVRKPKSPPGRDRRLTAREEKQILRYSHAYSNPELYSIFVIAIESAMRQGEILNLKWEHINLKSRIAHLPETKNGSKRDVPLSIPAREALTRLGTKLEGSVFSYKAAGLKSVWRLMTITLGIEDLHFHDTRHEACSRLIEMGTMDLMEVASITGHKSLSMLKRYTHLRAVRLVKKLDGPRNKNQQAIIDLMVSYPASIQVDGEDIILQLLDFKDLAVRAKDREKAVALASDALLRRIAVMAKKRVAIPQPDQYLDPIDKSHILMIDPLPQTDDEYDAQEL